MDVVDVRGTELRLDRLFRRPKVMARTARRVKKVCTAVLVSLLFQIIADASMIYHNVCIESVCYSLPEERVTSRQIESSLAPLYGRLELEPGILEGMFGIRQRRFWPPGTQPSEISTRSAQKAIAAAGIDRRELGAIIHGSVCRDFVEPATACLVHYGLGLPAHCVAYDVSNACLGLLNGVVQLANMIELGQIRYGLVVGTESSRELVEQTIELLNSDQTMTRLEIGDLIASLTFGSASAALVLCRRQCSASGRRLVAVTGETYSAGVFRNRTDPDASLTGKAPRYMKTDSAGLLADGISLTRRNFENFLATSGWSRADLAQTICHQVGARARKLLLQALELDADRDFTTFEELGNTGAVAIPMTLALALEQTGLAAGARLALIGTGGGINSITIGIQQYGVAT